MKIFDTIIAFVLLTSADSSMGHPQYLYKTPAIAFNEGEGGAESTTTASASAIETTTTTTEQNEVVETTPCCLKELARADVETTTGFGTETTTGSGTETKTGETTTGQTDVIETTTTGETYVIETTTTGQTYVIETTTTGQTDGIETTTGQTTTTGAEEPTSTEIPTTTTEKVSSPKPQKGDRTSGGKSLELPPGKIEELKSSDNLRTKCRNQKVGPGRFKFICDGVREDLITLQYEHILWLTNDGSGQVIDIEVPNYKINELIKAGYKTTGGSDTEINVLLKRPQQDANAEVDDLVVPIPSPAVSVLYEPPISQITHFPTNKKYRALSGPILPPN